MARKTDLSDAPKKLVTQRHWRIEKRHMEHQEDKVSMTVPDEAMSLQQILDKFSRGMDPGGVVREGVYDSNPDFDSVDLESFKTMDLADQEEVILEHAEYVQKMREAFKAKSDAAKEEKRQEMEDYQEVVKEARKKRTTRKDLESEAEQGKRSGAQEA